MDGMADGASDVYYRRKKPLIDIDKLDVAIYYLRSVITADHPIFGKKK